MQGWLRVHGDLRQRGADVRRGLPPQDGRLAEVHAPSLPRRRHALQHPKGKYRKHILGPEILLPMGSVKLGN